MSWDIRSEELILWIVRIGSAALILVVVTCSPDCYQSEVESGSFMMVG